MLTGAPNQLPGEIMTYTRQGTPLGQSIAPTVAATVPVPVAAGVMRRLGIDNVVVIDHGNVCGVLTDHHLVRAATLEPGHRGNVSVGDVCCRRLADVVTPNPFLVDKEATVAQAARVMLEAGAGAAVVVGDDAVSGVVTGRDLAAAAALGGAVEVRVRDICVPIAPVSLDDGLERAVGLVALSQGRPLPVVARGEPVGTIQIPLSSAAPPA